MNHYCFADCTVDQDECTGDWEEEDEHEITDMRELFEDLPEA